MTGESDPGTPVLYERVGVGIRAVAHDIPTQTTDPRPDDVHLQRVLEWLARTQDVTGCGGSAATYNLVLGWEDAYPETSGYIVPTLLDIARTEEISKYRDRALRMADWLCDIQQPPGSFPSGIGETGDPNVFNTAQIVFGLQAAYEATGEQRYESALRDACDWLCNQQTGDGYWDTYDYKGQAHAYSARIGWALAAAAESVPDQADRYQDAARRNFGWVCSLQRPDGWIERAAFEEGESPDLHTIAYTVRGLLEGGVALGDDDIRDAALRTAAKLRSMQESDGVLRGAYDEGWSPAWYYCLTGNAQMAIVWYRAYEETGADEYRLAGRTAVEFLKRHHVLDGPGAIAGSMPGSYPIVGQYMCLRYPNWAAKFFADALVLAQHHATRERSADRPAPDGRCRVCLLCDGDTVQQWVADALERMIAETNAEITLVVTNEAGGTAGRDTIRRGMKYPAYGIFWIACRIRNRLTRDATYDRPVPLREISGYADAKQIRTYPTNVDGLWNELPDEVVDEITASADVIVRRGFGLIRGDVLTATPYGVLSYHHGDPRSYRGGPAGFWEYVNDEDRAGMMVQRLSSELDAGEVLAYDEISLESHDSWGDAREDLYEESTGLLAEAIQHVQAEAEPALDIDDGGTVYNPPDARTLIRYAAKRYNI